MRTDWMELRRIDIGVEASVCIRCGARYSTDWATKLLSEFTRSHVPEHALAVGDESFLFLSEIARGSPMMSMFLKHTEGEPQYPSVRS